MTILVFGKSGQVATELQARADVVALSRADVDLGDPLACADAIRRHAPAAVINAAAYTAVDQAETDVHNAFAVNADAPAAMAAACAKIGAGFYHISTDYVFDGTGEDPFRPNDPTGPLGVYGQSKLAGEKAVQLAGGHHVILRTSWVFSAHGSNFVKTMLRLGAERDMLTVVADQVGGPTFAGDIADALLAIAKAPNGPSGIYHYAGAPAVSWADFAREIFLQAGLACEVKDIPSSQFQTPAKRPANSRLDGSSLLADYGIAAPDWRIGLKKVLDAL